MKRFIILGCSYALLACRPAPTPEIYAIEPTSGRVNSIVEVSGKDFGSLTNFDIYFKDKETGGFEKNIVETKTDTLLRLKVPKLSLGAVELVVRNSEGSDSIPFALSVSETIGKNADWVALGTGDGFGCVLSRSGTLQCWRQYTDYRPEEPKRFTDRNEVGQFVPMTVGEPESWLRFSTGRPECLLRKDGSIWCIDFGDVGHIVAKPEIKPYYSDVTFVTAGVSMDHACGIKADGSLWCWGANGSGQAGQGTTEPVRVPTQVGFDKNWTAVTVGDSTTCALNLVAELWCWGASPDFSLYANPKKFAGAWENVDSGTLIGAAIAKDGSLWSVVFPKYAIKQVSKSHWTQVSANGWNACAVEVGGDVYCWGGYNETYAIGERDFSGKTEPRRMPFVSHVKTVATSSQYSCALSRDGLLTCWGGISAID